MRAFLKVLIAVLALSGAAPALVAQTPPGPIVKVGYVALGVAPELVVVGARQNEGNFLTAVAVLRHCCSGRDSHKKQFA